MIATPTVTSVSATENRKQLAKVKVGLVGCGYWGPKLARNLHNLAEAELTMVCDLRQDCLDKMRCLYPGTVTTRDFNDLLRSDLNAIVIATPLDTHYPLAKAALAAGKHVLVEKPMASSSKHAKELVNLAELHNLILLVGHTFEYNPAVRAIKQIIASGELGQIHYIDATRVNLGLFRPESNVIWDLAPHDLSILRYILGQDPLSISARGKTCVQPHTGLYDVAYLTLYFPNDVLATLKVSWLEPVKVRRITVIGSRKMLVYDDTAENKVIVYDKAVELHPFADTGSEAFFSYRQGKTKNYPLKWEEPLHVETQHFIDCIQGKTDLISNGKVGVKIVNMLEKAQQSLQKDGDKMRLYF